MANRGEGVSRSEVTERVGRHHEGLDEKGRDIDRTVSDIETIRKTLEEVVLKGTSDAAEEIERAIEGAEALSVDEFTQESGQPWGTPRPASVCQWRSRRPSVRDRRRSRGCQAVH